MCLVFVSPAQADKKNNLLMRSVNLSTGVDVIVPGVALDLELEYQAKSALKIGQSVDFSFYLVAPEVAEGLTLENIASHVGFNSKYQIHVTFSRNRNLANFFSWQPKI